MSMIMNHGSSSVWEYYNGLDIIWHTARDVPYFKSDYLVLDVECRGIIDVTRPVIDIHGIHRWGLLDPDQAQEKPSVTGRESLTNARDQSDLRSTFSMDVQPGLCVGVASNPLLPTEGYASNRH